MRIMFRRALRALLEEVHDGLVGDALWVEALRENAADLTAPAQTADLVIRKQQGLLEYDLPICRGQRRSL